MFLLAISIRSVNVEFICIFRSRSNSFIPKLFTTFSKNHQTFLPILDHQQ